MSENHRERPNLKSLCLTLTSILLVTASTVFSQALPDKVLGTNDLVLVDKEASNIPYRYKKIVNAFGGIMYTEKDEAGEVLDSYYACTATHLGRGYVITAGHCVGATDKLTSQDSCKFISEPYHSKNNFTFAATIDFGYRDQVVPFMKSECKEIVAAVQDRTTGFDFAILKVSPYPDEFILPDTTRRSIYGDTVTIFSHPSGEPLQWSKSCGVERVLHPRIEKEFIHHQCDTKPGSSGASIINVLSLKVVGVHGGGINDMDEGTGRPLKSGMNYGTYILNSPLYDELRKLGF